MARTIKTCIAIIVVWLALIAIDALLVRDPSSLVAVWQTRRFLVNAAFGAATLLCFCVCWAGGISTARHARWWRPLLVVAFVLPAAAQAGFYSIFATFVSPFAIGFFVENPLLTAQMSGDTVAYGRVAVVVILTGVCAWWLVYRLPPPAWWLRLIAGVLGALLWLTASLSWYGVTDFQHATPAFYGAALQKGVAWRQQHFVLDRPSVPPTSRQSLPNIIFVIGESLNVGHMSLYGYGRPTTPQLDALRDDGLLVAFRNAVSIGTKTRLSVPYMLTGQQGIDPRDRIYTVPTLFNYARSVGYTTALVSSQDFGWGNLDTLLVDEDVDYFVDALAVNPNATVSIGADDHEMFDQIIEPLLARTSTPLLLVIQMNGSHYPYRDNANPRYKRFLPESEPNGVNAYDNTVVSSDDFLARLIARAQALPGDDWVFFSSDHGQVIDGVGGFHIGYSDEVIHNPLFVVAPPSYRQALRANIDAPVSQADIVATILDIIDLQPIRPIDGVSLLTPVDQQRLRIVSSYMATWDTDEDAILVYPDRSADLIDFVRRSVRLRTGDVIPYANYDKRHYFDRYLQEP